jgi:hypothetical protein
MSKLNKKNIVPLNSNDYYGYNQSNEKDKVRLPSLRKPTSQFNNP